ncbi:MAG: hypothetical protein D6768_18570, partial [Chloroflexi bacterium]
MTSYNNSELMNLKRFLILIAVVFAVSASILIFMFSSAATSTGNSPELAISLVSGENTGILPAGNRRWFRITPAQRKELRFSMFFRGANDPNVNFELYSGSEIAAGGQLDSFGKGQPVSRSGQPDLGERIWHGKAPQDSMIYLAVDNGSGENIDYWLYDADMLAPGLPAPEDTPAVAAAPNSAPAAAPAAAPESVPAPPPVENLGQTPPTARVFQFDRNTGGLEPGQEAWYTFSVDNTPDQFEPMALTMIVTPDDGNRIWNVNVDIFTAAEVRNWSPGNTRLNNVGAGSVVFRDANPLTGERVWSGWVLN